MGSKFEREINFLDQPKILNEVQYQKPNIGFLPTFRDINIKHGFSWGINSPNMAYKYHQGNPDIITQLNNDFLNNLGMESLSDSILMEAYGDTINILDITNSYLANTLPTDKGRWTADHVVFTNLPKVPIILKPGDCSGSLVYAITQDRQPLIGIIHSGRNELTAGIPKKGIEYLKTKYGCDPSSIKIGILPCLGPENHTIKSDTSNSIPNFSLWNQYVTKDSQNNLHLNIQGLLTQQFIDQGILGSNIEICQVDTYQAAAKGESFSHRFALDNQLPEKNGRFMISIQLA